MARKKRPTRTTADYLASASELSKLVPSLRKFKRRKTLTKSEKASIRRREKQKKNVPFIFPVSKQQAKKLGRRRLFMPGFQAIQLRSTKEVAAFKASDKIHIGKHGDISITQDGQRWIYWSLDRNEVRSRVAMRTRGAEAFNKQFPIERVADLAVKAFATYKVQQVHLWAHAGIVGDAFHSIEDFVRWVNKQWNAGRYMSTRYREGTDEIYTQPSDPGKWINGIAILIEDETYTKRRKKIDGQAKASKNAV